MTSAASHKMKMSVTITGTELAFIDDLLQRDPVAIVFKVGRAISLQ